MALTYKTILCPVDFDENSVVALDKAAEIARHFGSTIILVHVLELVLTSGEIYAPPAMFADQEKAARAKLEDVAKQKLGGIQHEALIYTGDVVGCIMQAETKHKPDLIVIATHGRKGLKRMILGSVAEAVVRKAACPVLTIRE
jgi:universal stress protein A